SAYPQAGAPLARRPRLFCAQGRSGTATADQVRPPSKLRANANRGGVPWIFSPSALPPLVLQQAERESCGHGQVGTQELLEFRLVGAPHGLSRKSIRARRPGAWHELRLIEATFWEAIR